MDGYKFSNWEDDVNAAAERTIIVKGDSTFTANFEEIASSSSESSSSAEESSSSKAKSSSSSAKDNSSSSKKIGITSVAEMHFSVTAGKRNILFAGAPTGAKFAILDMQGRVTTAGRVESANFSVPVMRAGNYLVRVNGITKIVKLK